MEADSKDKRKKRYSPPVLIKLTQSKLRKLVADCKNCNEEEAADFLNSLRQQQLNQLEEVRDKRRHQRLELEVEVIVRTGGELLPGRTQDISESGMSALLPVELREGQEVELQIKLPSATQTARVIVRHRNVFRHGFEFVQPLHGIFRTAAVTGRP